MESLQLLAQPWWVNLLIVVPICAYVGFRRESLDLNWSRLAAGAMQFAEVHADRGDRVACLANLCQAVLAAAQGRLAAAGEWVLNEKRLVQRARLGSIQDRLDQDQGDLPELVSDVRALLGVHDTVWKYAAPDA